MSEAHSDTNVSYWVETAGTSDYPTLQGQIETDVAVIGAGIVGVTTAHLLKRAGLKVVVVEMDRIGRGVSGYTTAKLTAGHGTIYQQLENKHGRDTASQYAAANQIGLEQIAHLVEEEGIACDFERRANYVYSESEDGLDVIKAEVAAAQRAGLDTTFVDELDLPYRIAGAVKLDGQAQFHPRKYLAHLCERIAAEGSHIFERTRALALSEGDRSRVTTDGGEVVADYVVLANHYPFLDQGLFFPRVHPMRSYAVAGPIHSKDAPAGMYISVDRPTRSIRQISDGDRTLLMVGGNGHAVGQRHDTQHEYDDLENWMEERFAVTDVTHRWSSQDGVTVDQLPYVGTARRTSERVLTATGFGKWGLTNGTVAADILSDRILGRSNKFAELFDPHRLTIRASSSRFLTGNIKVGFHFLNDRISHPQEGSLHALRPGEACVQGKAHGQVAAYRDEAGTLHTVSAQCTHLGCIVTWNNAEKSWDCPCHGSRFDYEGRLLHGPATRDLPRVTP